MLDDRKAAILRAVVEEYIQTAQPVGSAHVARQSHLSVSSATVRNDMGVLEREGYLVQPHTSAGRIPTDKGYRFFVDSLTAPGPLEASQSEQVRDFFARAHGELERLLDDTSHLLSGLTHYAAVVVKPSAEVARIRSLQLVGLGPRLLLLVAVLSNATIEKRSLELADELSDASVATASVRLAAHLDGLPWEPVGPLPPSGEPVVDSLTNRAAALIGTGSGGERDQVFVGGAARMASAFDAVEKIRQVLGILEQQFVLVTLLRDVIDQGRSVAIGTEHGVEPLADCSVVVAPYGIEGEQAGTVGILGPTRMHYDQALAAVAVVSTRLSRALSEGI